MKKRKKNSKKAPSKIIYITGTIDYIDKSYAYLMSPALPQDIRLSTADLLHAWDKDTVKAAVKIDKKGRKKAKVVAILQRHYQKIAVQLIHKGEYIQALPTQKIYHPIHITTQGKSITTDDKYIIKITQWPTKKLAYAQAILVKKLGTAGNYFTEMQALITDLGIPTCFSEAIKMDVEKIKTTVKMDTSGRRDYRQVPTFTIDPEDAQDFDDALSIEKLSNGHFSIGVHIADVSHYVKPGTALDEAAFERGNTIYMLKHTLPMLPIYLSNDICSLKPLQDRLAFSIIFTMDTMANIKDYWIGKTIIHSQKRFTYESAQKVLDQKKGPYHEALYILYHLAQKLRQRRFAHGSIHFHTQEIQFQFDTQHNILDSFPKPVYDTHHLVEEWMLLANKTIAKFIQSKKVPSIYRTHDVPDSDQFKQFLQFLSVLDIHMSKKKNKPTPQNIQQIHQKIQGIPQENLLHQLSIRSMAKAIYTPNVSLHFGLGFSTYTHFTSPIRRYADIMVHRILKRLLMHQKPVVSMHQLAKKCHHLVQTERSSLILERASIKHKQMVWVIQQKEKIFQGMIVGLVDWGFYVALEKIGCEGLVRLSDIKEDHYIVHHQKFAIVGKKTQKKYQLGQNIEVKVKSYDLEKRLLDFIIVS